MEGKRKSQHRIILLCGWWVLDVTSVFHVKCLEKLKSIRSLLSYQKNVWAKSRFLCLPSVGFLTAEQDPPALEQGDVPYTTETARGNVGEKWFRFSVVASWCWRPVGVRRRCQAWLWMTEFLLPLTRWGWCCTCGWVLRYQSVGARFRSGKKGFGGTNVVPCVD